MPTAGRLTAAVLFALLVWYVTEKALAVMPSVYDRPGVAKWNALIALCTAWSLFRKIDGTLKQSTVLALTTSVIAIAVATLCHSCAMTFDAAWRGRTGNLITTFEKVFSNMGDMTLQFVLAQQAMATLFAGALAIAAAAAVMERRFS